MEIKSVQEPISEAVALIDKLISEGSISIDMLANIVYMPIEVYTNIVDTSTEEHAEITSSNKTDVQKYLHALSSLIRKWIIIERSVKLGEAELLKIEPEPGIKELLNSPINENTPLTYHIVFDADKREKLITLVDTGQETPVRFITYLTEPELTMAQSDE